MSSFILIVVPAFSCGHMFDCITPHIDVQLNFNQTEIDTDEFEDFWIVVEAVAGLAMMSVFFRLELAQVRPCMQPTSNLSTILL